MKTYPAITQEFLKSILDYDSLTGIFTWRNRTDVIHHGRWNKRNAGKPAGTVTRYGYVRVQIGKRVHYAAHVLAWLYVYGEYAPGKIDHIDGNRAQNCITNLRKTNASTNGVNKAMQRNNKSGYVGVHFNTQSQKWVAKVTVDKKTYHVGSFDNPVSAFKARAEFAPKLQGEFVPKNPDRKKYVHGRDQKNHADTVRLY